MSASDLSRAAIDWILANMDALPRAQIEAELAKSGYDPVTIGRMWESANRTKDTIVWISENAQVYSRPQVDAQLANAGYDPASIQAMWDAAEPVARTLSRGEKELLQATNGWNAPVVVRTYDSNKAGDKLFVDEAAVMAKHDYEPTMQSAEGSHLHAGRLLLTGGLSIFAGRSGIRSKGKLTVTFRKIRAAAAVDGTQASADPMDQLRKLAELRDSGVVTPDEFEAKKAELLRRM